MNHYRLSLDIGTNSIGWCALSLKQEADRLDPVGILDMGVRIFPDGRNPKDGSSNAVKRRLARSMRRNRDRYLERRSRLLDALTEAGLMPRSEAERRTLATLDPYTLRAKGLDEKLTLYELGRAVFHLNQRRGFKSNRKQDAKVKETGAIKTAINAQRTGMDAVDARTFGEYLYFRREKGQDVRARLKTVRILDDKGRERNQDYYDIYPSRESIEEELNALWRAQAIYYPAELTEVGLKRIRDIIIVQREMKKPVVGRCTFEPSEDRLPKASPLAQRCRVYQELNHLTAIDTQTLQGRSLRIEERDTLARVLCQPKGNKKGKPEITFERMRRILHLDNVVFSLESEKRSGLEVDTTSALLAHSDRFGSRWFELSDDQQEDVVSALLDMNDEEQLIQHLIKTFGLDREHAQNVADSTPLPEGYARLGKTATRKILTHLVEDVIPYSEAVVRAGYESHSEFATGAARDRLPYYGLVLERHVVPDPEEGGHPGAPLEQRYGKLTNPTVHIALNQLRKVVNEVIKLHGKPAAIHVEVLRELKNSVRRRKEIEAEQAANRAKNSECARRLREEFNLPAKRENIQRLRLWDELDSSHRVCIYTGANISCKNLFSPEVEIDHILPFTRTLDDGMANKILCMRSANRQKSNATPFEAWGSADCWPDILARSAILPKNKRWRFAEDAMKRYESEGDFIARQLTDSQYIAKLARTYLCSLYPAKDQHKVVCIPGRLTGLFRHHLGMDDILDEINPSRLNAGLSLGEKNRHDHRNHALDALVVGLMDRAFLQRAASANARLEVQGVYKLLDDFEEPWPSFRESVTAALSRIIVSHKPDHGIETSLHDEMPFGRPKRPDLRGNVTKRVETRNFEGKDILAIKGRNLRAALVAGLAKLDHNAAFSKLDALDHQGRKASSALLELLGISWDEATHLSREFLRAKCIRHVRLIMRENSIRGIADKRSGTMYKYLKTDGNAYFDLLTRDGSSLWDGEPIPYFDATKRKAERSIPESKADHIRGPSRRRDVIRRLFKGDLVEFWRDERCRIFRIKKFTKGKITFVEHFEAETGITANDDCKGPAFSMSPDRLRQAGPRFLTVTPAGRIRYLSDPPDDMQGP